ncbi:unnamed protein product, partial [Chrysoparadoxa australica]
MFDKALTILEKGEKVLADVGKPVPDGDGKKAKDQGVNECRHLLVGIDHSLRLTLMAMSAHHSTVPNVIA